MSTETDQIRTRIEALLAGLPDDADVDELARRLEEAHDVLVQALESVELGSMEKG
jgi:uncharacterized membrane protein